MVALFEPGLPSRRFGKTFTQVVAVEQ